MAADLVKFRSGDNEKAQDETVVLLDPGQILFGLTRKEDGSFFGSIWYDVFDDKYNIVQRVPMGGANAAGSYTAGALSIADKNGHAGDQVVITDVNEATLLLPKHICAEYFAADTSFDITHSPFNTGESRQYGNGFVITNPSENKQEGWLRLIGENGSKNTTLELATRDSYSKDHKYNQVVIRQYDGNGNIIADQDELLREAILLGVNGETYFPGPVTSARGFIGDLTGHASSATKAQYDWLDNDIAETYFASVEEKVSNAAYQLDFANGAGTILKTIFMPVADAIKAGLITADRDHPQTLTGQKILDEYGGIQIKAPSGFDYKGIQDSKNEVSTTIWFSKENVQGTPVYDNTFTYDSKKHLLKVQNVEGLISNATADKENNQIDDHYFCYFETANDAASYTIWGMPDTGTKRDFHASPTGALEKNKLVKIVVPIATEDKAGIITADKNNPQYLAGTKYLQGSFILNSVDGQFIGQYYNKANPKDGYWKLQGDKNDDSLLLETLTNAKNTYGKIVIQQKNGSNGLSKIELANIYGNTGLHSLSITDNGDGLNNTSPYVLYINTTRKGDSNQLYSNSVFINNIINTATTVYFGTMNGDSDALYYINDSNNPNAKKSTLVIKTGSTYQAFFAQFRSLYLDDDLYVGKGILNDGQLIQHGSAHLHDITHNHYFNGKKNDVEMGSWVTIDAKNTSTPNEVILTIGNKIAQGTLGNGKGFLRLYSHNNNYGQWSFNGQDFTPSHNIYFLNNYDKLTGWQNGIWGKVGKDDYWRVGGGATTESKGYLELSVANNNVESILVRKYADDFKNLGSGPDTKYEAALLDENGNTYFPKGLAINKNKSDSGYAGLSLYGDITNAQPMYGIIYRTMNGTSHGYTVDTNHYWATYFNIHSKTSGPYGEGWIFNNGTLDVASIDRLGNAQFNQICLNRRADSSTQSLKQTHGRISWYSPTYYTWYDYMSEPSAGYAPTGAAPSKIGNVTSWARRSLIENTSGYGWVWESCQNKASEIPVAWLGLSANDGRLIMHGKEIYYAGSTSTISMIRWIENTANNSGHGIGIGGGGITIIGSGESANSSNFAALTTNGETKVAPGDETLYLLSDNNIFLETNAQSFSARLGLKIDTTGALIPVIAESPYDRGLNIGSPTVRWSNIYANVLRLQGPSSNPSATAGARIEFTYDDGSSRLQPVYISYTPNDSYRAPYGLKIWGSDNASYGAWLEVQGGIGTSNTSSSSGIGISLHNGPVNGKPTYGMFFGGTSTFGKLYNTTSSTYGVSSDWATYFTMSDTTNRGWLFMRGATNVAGITGNGTFLSVVSTGSHIAGNKGKVIIDGTAAAGYNMLFRQKSTNGVFTGGAYNTEWNLYYTANSVITAGTNSTTSSIRLINESGNTLLNRLGINGENTSYRLYVNGTSLFGSTLTANGQIISKVASGTSPFVIISSTVNANLNADLLDGYHESAFLRYSGWWNSGSGQKVDNASGMIFAYSDHGLPGSWGVVTTFDYSKNSAYRHQIYGDGWNNEMYFRTRSSDKGGWNEWRHLLDSVNYTGTLDGRYVNVTGDTMTGNLTAPSVYTSNWFRSTGATGWFNETYGGGIYMQDSTWVRVYNNKLFYVSSTNQSAIHTAGGIDARGEIRSFAANGFRLCYGSKPVIFRNDGSNFYILISNNSNAGNNWITPSGGAHPLRIDLTTGYCYSSRMYSAVWNDYAEYRHSKEEEPGRVVMEDNFGICHRATTRLQSFAGVVSDTFGFSQGETKDAKTPLAVAGRVLVYPYQDPSNYQPGDCVCAAPNGTVDIMTREEVVQWPDRIVGTVSEIPDYEVWSDGKVKVNGRIWIKVR